MIVEENCNLLWRLVMVRQSVIKCSRFHEQRLLFRELLFPVNKGLSKTKLNPIKITYCTWSSNLSNTWTLVWFEASLIWVLQARAKTKAQDCWWNEKQIFHTQFIRTSIPNSNPYSTFRRQRPEANSYVGVIKELG